MKESLRYTLVIATALSSYRLLEATTLPLHLVQNVGTLNNSSGWIRVRPQDPVTVACTSSCGLVEWTVIPNSAYHNITVLSRTDQRCNSTSGVCVNVYSEPCPGEEDEYMLFKLSLKTTVTFIIQCNAYVVFKTDLTIRHMIRGDSFLVIAEEEESIAVSPSLQAVTPSSTLAVNECIQTSSSVTTAAGASHTSSQLTPGLTFTSYAAVTRSTILPAPTTMTPTVGFGLKASPQSPAAVNPPMTITGSSIPVTLCSFNSYLIVTVVLGGLLILSLIALFITCICCKYSSSRTVSKSDDLATASTGTVSPLSHTKHSSSAYHDTRVRPSSRELDIIEYSDPSDLPISTTV